SCLTSPRWQPASNRTLPSMIAAVIRASRLDVRLMRISWKGVCRSGRSLAACRLRVRGFATPFRQAFSSARKGHALLALILAAAILVTGFAFLVGFEEQHLRHALVGVDFCGRGVVLENSSVTWPSHSG